MTSCQSDLDIIPEDLTTRDKAFQTELGVRSYVTGMYGLAQQEGALNGVYQTLAEYQSDNVTFIGSFPTLREIRDYTTISDNGNIFSIWDDHYEIIAQANYIINKIDSCPDPNLTLVKKNQAIGEAKFMRALMYLDLINLFGQPFQNGGLTGNAVPLILTTITDSQVGTTGTARSSIGVVYNQIENDLLDAITKITVFNRTRANVGAAKALLARVYLYQDKFGQAADYANQVITDVNFTFSPNYLFFDSPLNAEHVFTLVNTTDDAQAGSADNGSAVAFSNVYNAAAIGGRGDCPFSANLISAFLTEPTDLRYTLKAISGTRTYTTKFSDAANRASDAPVLRITEMYLIRAEGNLRASTNIGDTPLNDINKLRTRAGLSNLLTIDLTKILNEKRKELCFEGHRRMDLLRNGLPLRSGTLPQSSLSAAGLPKTIMPIPQREIDLSIGRVLIQNPTY